MKTGLYDQDEGVEMVKAKIASREWWIIPQCGEAAADFVQTFEEAFYKGEANADFVVMMIPRPCEGIIFSSIAFGKKTRASKEGVAKICGVPLESLDKQDVLLTPTLPAVFLAWFLDTFAESEGDHMLAKKIWNAVP